jgi:hypothetical protein
MVGSSSRRYGLMLALVLGSDLVIQHPAGVIAASQRGLDSFMVPLAPCKDPIVTPAAANVPFFRAGSPQRTTIAEPGAPGVRLVLSGMVSGVTCGFIKGARVDFWQADAKGVYDRAGFKFRGHQLTNADGRYRLETVVPGSSGGRPRAVNVRIDVEGKTLLTTQLFFPDEPPATRDKGYRADLAVTFVPPAEGRSDVGGVRTATFDFLLNK